MPKHSLIQRTIMLADNYSDKHLKRSMSATYNPSVRRISKMCYDDMQEIKQNLEKLQARHDNEKNNRRTTRPAKVSN